MESGSLSQASESSLDLGSASLWLAILLLAHPLSLGPIAYLGERGWLGRVAPREALEILYYPELWAVNSTRAKHPEWTAPYVAYVEFFERLGRTHK